MSIRSTRRKSELRARPEGVEYAVSVLKEYVAKANEALSVLPDSREKEYLTRIAGFTAYRNN